MEKLPKKYIIKIPNNVTVVYCRKKKIITLVGPLAKKSLELKVKIALIGAKKIIVVTSIMISETSNNEKKNVKAIQGTTISLLKQALIEVSTITYKILKLVGVGYRAFNVENYKGQLLMLKLGYSHPIFINASKGLQFFCLKFTKLFIYGSSYQAITQASSQIQFYKEPEPYKGKGIIDENKKTILKEVKKT